MYAKIQKISGKQVLLSVDDEIDLSRMQRWSDGKQPTVELIIDDGRRITPDQRKKIFAMLGDMSDYLGYSPREIEEIMKTKFICEHPHPKWFSMSDCSVSLANSFLTFIIDFCIKQDIPFKTKVIDEIWNDYGLIRECCLHRKCVICGKRAQIHHVDTIGMGNNRTEVNHIGRKILPLCVIHHREFHDIGAITFFRKYQVKPIKVDKELAVKLRLESQERVNNTNGDFRETPKTSTNL